MIDSISPTGISVIYEPEASSAVVDIVLVHGLKGHPYKTWLSSKSTIQRTDSKESPAAQTQVPDNSEVRHKRTLRNSMSWLSRKSSSMAKVKREDTTSTAGSNMSESAVPNVFWPGELLPTECPKARILTYGYDSKITKYMSAATNKNTMFAHGKDFLFSLNRERPLGRPLIFFAHSLGGIVVKEMLARSSTSSDTELKNVVEPTAAVVFLGTPHRGSPDLSSLGEWLRSIISVFRIDTTSTILDALGLKTNDLERAQDAFSGIWQQYDFRIKTFQEGLGLTGIRLGVLGNKVVPDFSSLIGDQRENAETLQANHLEICRFTGPNDPNYIKVVRELRSIYHSVDGLNIRASAQDKHIRDAKAVAHNLQGHMPLKASQGRHKIHLTEKEEACLESLRFPNMNRRRYSIGPPAMQTCNWLFEHQTYQDWFHNRNWHENHGMLVLKGKPGAGKSTLMKEALRRATLEQDSSDYCTAAFFFNAKSYGLENSAVGLLRTLLYQISLFNPKTLSDLCDIKGSTKSERAKLQEMRAVLDRIRSERKLDDTADLEDFLWSEDELVEFMRSLFSQPLDKRVFIFIDALDESISARSQIFFWRELTESIPVAGRLNVFLSIRHFPSITINGCSEILMEDYNSLDISTYVNQRFKGIEAKEKEREFVLLKQTILSQANNIFLWVVLVVNRLLQQWDEGKSIVLLLKHVNELPQELDTLFSEITKSLNSEDLQLALNAFQWAILALRPLRLYEWHHILGFAKPGASSSLREWRNSEDFTDSDTQLERKIRSISGGLLEVSTWTREKKSPHKGFDALSIVAGAGSLDYEQGETRVVQTIHQSVREFFLSGNGFSVLYPTSDENWIGRGHVSIMDTCLDYICISELDALVEARYRRGQPISNLSPSAASLKDEGQIGSTAHQPNQTVSKYPDGPYREESRLTTREKTTSRDLIAQWKKENQEKISMFELIRNSYPLAAATDVYSWIGENAMSECAKSRPGSTRLSISQRSVSFQSQMLQDHPALLEYATFSLFAHARLAQNAGMDLADMFLCLKDPGIWNRWVALREDVPWDISLLDYATYWEGLEFDKSMMEEKPSPPDSPQPKAHKTNRQFSEISENFEVASFSSASSYAGRSIEPDGGM